MSKKRGRLSTEEEQYIMNSINIQSIEDIAATLGRTEKTIEAFCKKHQLTYGSMSEAEYDDAILKARLKSRPYWGEVTQQFTDAELEYFIENWVLLIKQFREDVLYTEELQMKQWITLEIMGNRVMKDRRHAQENIDRLEGLLHNEYAIPHGERNADRIMHLETELSMVRNSLSAHTTEHSKILDRVKDITKDLKGARADRIKTIEDSKQSFSAFLKSLEDESLRARVGEDIEIMRLAKNKAKERLAEYHTYADGYVDQPLLTPETAKEDEYE